MAASRKNHSRARPGRSRCKREPGSAQNRSVILNEVKNLISTVFHYVQHDKYPIIPYPLGIKKRDFRGSLSFLWLSYQDSNLE